MHKNFFFCALCALCLTACAVPASRPVLSTPLPSQTAQTAPLPTPTALAPTALPSPQPPACHETSGKSEQIAYDAPGFSNRLSARIHLPPCYDASGQTRYPVLYLLHGQGFTSDQWERIGAPAVLDRLVSQESYAPFLIVLPEEPDTFANPFDSPFGQAVPQSLVPFIDETYPTCARRECRAIGGLSRGAAWAVYLALQNPTLFCAAGAHSFPPFQGLDRKLKPLLAAIPAGTPPPALYIDIGARDPYRSPAAQFEALLNQTGLPHEWYLNQGEHNETYWSAHVEEYMRWYAAHLQFRSQP